MMLFLLVIQEIAFEIFQDINICQIISFPTYLYRGNGNRLKVTTLGPLSMLESLSLSCKYLIVNK